MPAGSLVPFLSVELLRYRSRPSFLYRTLARTHKCWCRQAQRVERSRLELDVRVAARTPVRGRLGSQDQTGSRLRASPGCSIGAGKRREEVVEAAVLLNHDDDVLDVRRGARRRRDAAKRWNAGARAHRASGAPGHQQDGRQSNGREPARDTHSVIHVQLSLMGRQVNILSWDGTSCQVEMQRRRGPYFERASASSRLRALTHLYSG